MKYPLHFVGNATYSEELFIRESMRYGVSRALPLNIAVKLRPGDVVLLARKVREGARVFGYFVVEGYSLPEDVVSKIKQSVRTRCDNVDKTIHRGCGSYTVSSICVVEDDWDKLVEKIKELRNVKIFVNGKFYPLNPFIVNARFTRGITYVDVDEKIVAEINERRLFGIRDYKRVFQRSQTDIKRLEQMYMGGVLDRWLR